MLFAFINLGDNFASTTLALAGSVVGDFSGLLSLVFGVLIAVAAVALLVRLFTHH